jgi:hypothetical protein
MSAMRDKSDLEFLSSLTRHPFRMCSGKLLALQRKSPERSFGEGKLAYLKTAIRRQRAGLTDSALDIKVSMTRV